MHRVVEGSGDLRNVTLGKGALVRIDGPAECVLANVAIGIRHGGRTDERQAHNVALGGVPIFAVVDEGHTVAILGQVGKLVPTDFKPVVS
jgi:hypothetical protein